MQKKKSSYKKTTIGEHDLKPESLMMSYGYNPKFSENAVKPPVFLTSTFVFDSAEEGEEFFHVTSGRKPRTSNDDLGGLIYSRFNHPNVEIVEDRIAVLEGSEGCVAFASGMGAISTTLLSYLRPGDTIVHSSPLYGGTETLIGKVMTEFGVKSHAFTDGLDKDSMLAAMRKAIKDGNLKMVFIETPANPTNALVDFQALNEALDIIESETGHRPVSVCDNTLMGPIFQQAVPQGIDLAVYSVTKYLGGHSDLVAGAVCGSKEKLAPIWGLRGAMGFNLDPHTSWMISRSLETVAIRMDRANDSAKKVAQWIHDNPYIQAELHHADFKTDPKYQAVFKRQCKGAGSTFAFTVDAPKATMFKFINALQLFKSAVSLGGSESLICHPASTTHSGVPAEARAKAKVTDGLVRLSIGLEHPDDLIADLDQAFKAAFGNKADKVA
ncbi:MAG: methionine gamma-lyase [Micavibrio sp.]|nr:methionine gamma-lyase [Micavibrio sp.]|tara:strand:+ start:4650 stop:5969 length:1320 start_codon:yes stop_codon:yes gene_type:complete